VNVLALTGVRLAALPWKTGAAEAGPAIVAKAAKAARISTASRERLPSMFVPSVTRGPQH
jgi:hypothetical protein